MGFFKGIKLTGLNLRVEDTFNSIPGLMQWNSIPELLTMYDDTKITRWGDKSNFPISLAMASPDKMPELEKNIWLKSNNNTSYLSGYKTNYRFLHNGSVFAVYSIMKNTFSTGSTTVTANSPFRTGSNATTGLVLTVSNINSGRFQASIKGGTTAPTREVTGFLSPESPDYTPNNSIAITACVNLGQTIGVIMRYGNAEKILPPFFATNAEYPTNQESYFIAAQGQVGMTVRESLLLIYNWEGYSNAQVQAFDAQVMELLRKEKQRIESLDI
jgi:hypothetical protein